MGKNKGTILSSLQACLVITHTSGDFIVFPLSQYISRSTSTYRALYYGKIETQTSHIYIYIYILYQIEQLSQTNFHEPVVDLVQMKNIEKYDIYIYIYIYTFFFPTFRTL